MKRAALIGGLLLLGMSAAAAAEPTDELRQLLAVAPALDLSSEDAALFSFVSLAALRELSTTGDTVDAAGWRRVVLALPPSRPLEALVRDAGDWETRTGIPPEAIVTLMEIGQPDVGVALWGLSTSAAPVMGALVGQDFELIDNPPSPFALVMGNGEPGIMDFTAIDRADPWRGATGQNSFVAVMGDVVIQAVLPESLAGYARGPSAVEQPEIAAILDGLDALPGSVRLIQGSLFSAALGTQQADPVPAGKQTLVRLPAYDVGFLLDAEVDGVATMVLAFAYDDCATASDAGANVIMLWQNATAVGYQFNEVVPADASATTYQGDGTCAVVVLFPGGPNGDTANAAYALAMAAIGRREFAPIAMSAP